MSRPLVRITRRNVLWFVALGAVAALVGWLLSFGFALPNYGMTQSQGWFAVALLGMLFLGAGCGALLGVLVNLPKLIRNDG